MLVHVLIGRRQAEVVDADGASVIADVLVPVVGDSGLHRDARLDRGRQHRGLVCHALGVEYVGARHRDDPGGDAPAGEHLRRLHGDADLRSGRDDDGVRRLAGVPQDVSAPRRVGELLVAARLVGQPLT